MTAVEDKRRQNDLGSIVCDNEALRLRVIQEHRSLAVVIEAINDERQWGPLAFQSSGTDVSYARAIGDAREGVFSSFDPVELDGRTQGLVLHGHLGDLPFTSTILLRSTGPWFTQRLHLAEKGRENCRRLLQRWRVSGVNGYPEVAWPHSAIRGEEAEWNPAAFLQEGALFAALALESDEDDLRLLCLQLILQDTPSFVYGWWVEETDPPIPPLSKRLHAQLCLDARALRERGFQQVVRLLGSRETLAPSGSISPDHECGTLPALPVLPASIEWHPFMWEGAPTAIAAWVEHCFTRAGADDWSGLETGLIWLDRLCLHQCTLGMCGESVIGSFGRGPQWEAVACWMPILLLRAYRFTGIPEYAYRGQAALRALPGSLQQAVLEHLHPTFGDLYINATFQEMIPLSAVQVLAGDFTDDGLRLQLCAGPSHSLRIVLDGIEDDYTLTVNGQPCGRHTIAQYHAGIDIEIAE